MAQALSAMLVASLIACAWGLLLFAGRRSKAKAR
jgi:hypothetical protein